MKRILPLLLVVMLCAHAIQADTATFQNGLNGYTGTRDTYLDEANGTFNYGGMYTLTTTGNPDAHKRILLGFDDLFGNGPGQIGAGQTIESATLTLTTSAQGSVINTLLFPMLTTWKEGTALGGVQLDTSAWGYRDCWDARWGTGTGTAGPVYNVDTSAGDVVVKAISWQSGTSYDYDVTSTVQKWYDGTWDNNGFYLYLGSDGAYSAHFASSESTGTRPMLSITYTPEPATMSLLGLGGLALLRRRRRNV